MLLGAVRAPVAAPTESGALPERRPAADQSGSQGIVLHGRVAGLEAAGVEPPLYLDVETAVERLLVERALVGAGGLFATRPLPPAPYTLSVSDAAGREYELLGFAELTLDDSWRTRPLALALRPAVEAQPEEIEVAAGVENPAPAGTAGTGSISGTVTGADTGLPITVEPVRVELYDSASPFYHIAADMVDENGVYQFDNLPAATYFLKIIPDGSPTYLMQFYQTQLTMNEADPIVLADGAALIVDVELQNGGTITGEMRSTFDGSILPGRVDLYSHPSSPYVSRSSPIFPDGTFLIANLFPGDYYLHFRPDAPYLPEFYENRPALAAADPLTVTYGQLLSVTAYLERGGAIEGTVRVADELVPLSAGYVRLYDSPSAGSALRSVWISSGDGGAFLFDALPPGTYYLEVDPDPSTGILPTFYDGSDTLATAAPVQVSSGLTETVEILAPRGGVINGTVFYWNQGVSNPVTTRERLYLYDSSSQIYWLRSVSLTDGTFEMDGLAEGSYYLEFRPNYDSELLPVFYDGADELAAATPIQVTQGQTGTLAFEVPRGGTISGQVTAEGIGTPLPNVTVKLRQAADGSAMDTAYTDQNGSYQFTGLAAGEVVLEFVRASNTPYLSEFYQDAADFSGATPIPVTAGQDLVIDAALATGATLRGVVGSADGLPHVSGVARLFSTADPTTQVGFGSFENDPFFNPVTEAPYEIIGIPPGAYFVEFDVEESYGLLAEYFDGAAALSAATPITLTAGEERALDVDLARGGTIAGQLLSGRTGEPVIVDRIYLYSADGELLRQEFISSSDMVGGQFAVTGLRTGSYFLKFSKFYSNYADTFFPDAADFEHAVPISVTQGQTTTISPLMNEYGRIVGTITAADTGQPLPSVDVRFFLGPVTQWSSQTNSSGVFDRSSLEPGSYRLQFLPRSSHPTSSNYAPSFYNGGGNIYEAQSISVDYNQLVTLTATLDRGGTISGALTGAGELMPRARVFLYNAEDMTTVRTWQGVNSSTYELKGLQPGAYFLRFFGDTGFPDYAPYVSEYYDNQAPSSGSPTPIVVAAGEIVTIDADLSRGGTIAGTVESAVSGLPLSGIYVTVYSGTVPTPVRSTSTGSDGFFRLTGLAEGSYRLHFREGQAHLGEFYEDAADINLAQPLVIGNGQSVTVTAALEPAGRLVGTVVDEHSGALLPGIGLEFVHEDELTGFDGDPLQVIEASTDFAGTFDVPLYRAGRYYAYAEGNSSYAPEFYLNGETMAAAVPFTITDGVTTTMTLPLNPGGIISGVIVADTTGEPLSPSPSVAVYEEVGCGWERYVGEMVTNADGSYQFTGLAAGSYQVHARPHSSGNPLYAAVVQEGIIVTLGQATTVDFSLINPSTLNGTLSGRVLAEDTGLPLEDVFVSLYRQETGGHFEIAGSTTADSQGNYVAAGLQDGLYTLIFYPAEGYARQVYGGVLLVEDGATLAVVNGGAVAVPDVLLERSGVIAGQVFEALLGGTFAGSAQVELLTADGRIVAAEAPRHDNPSYRFENLPAGEYILRTIPPPPYIGQYSGGGHTLAQAQLVEVVSGQTTSVDVPLEIGEVIEVSAVDAVLGHYLYPKLTLYTEEGVLMETVRFVPEYGGYQSSGLPPGRYYLRSGPTSHDIARYPWTTCDPDLSYASGYYEEASTLLEAVPIEISEPLLPYSYQLQAEFITMKLGQLQAGDPALGGLATAGGDLLLDWPATAAGCDGYEIHHSLLPYFTPQPATLLDPPGVVAGGPLLIAPDPAGANFYQIRALCQEISTDSEPLGAFKFGLTPGTGP